MRRVQWRFSWCWGESEVWEETATWPCYLSVQVIFRTLDQIDNVTLWPVTCRAQHCFLPVANSWKVCSGEAKGLQESGSLQLLCERLGLVHDTTIRPTVNFDIKAAVRPSQQLSEKPHHPWVGLRQKDGSVWHIVHAWLGKYFANFKGSKPNSPARVFPPACILCSAPLRKHTKVYIVMHSGSYTYHVASFDVIAAVLFKVEEIVHLGHTSVPCTSRPCEWNQAFSKKNIYTFGVMKVILLPHTSLTGFNS